MVNTKYEDSRRLSWASACSRFNSACGPRPSEVPPSPEKTARSMVSSDEARYRTRRFQRNGPRTEKLILPRPRLRQKKSKPRERDNRLTNGIWPTSLFISRKDAGQIGTKIGGWDLVRLGTGAPWSKRLPLVRMCIGIQTIRP